MPEKATKTAPELVSVKDILERFGMPRTTLYRLVEQGRVPVHRQLQELWHSKARYLFSIPEVEAALKEYAAKARQTTARNGKGGKRHGSQ